jgi:hypothetical protein
MEKTQAKDDKSSGFNLENSKLRSVAALSHFVW